MSKKPAAVVAAEAKRDAKAQELAAAREVVKRLEAEHGAAIQAVRAALTEADAALPQCRMVNVARRSGAEHSSERMVILRKTPGGVLVVRRVGDTSAYEFRFCIGTAGVWSKVEKRDAYRYSPTRVELRDVPAEFMPAEAAQERA